MAKLQKLRSLDLTNTQITDTGLKEVAKLQQLKQLVLSHTQITDSGLMELTKLNELKQLEITVDGVRVTEEGRDRLNIQLGTLNIHTCYQDH